MARLQLEPGSDHVQRLAHEDDPVRAVAELIWNSLDADAHLVEVSLRRGEGGGVDGVTVVDDGHGMSPEAAESDFRWIGNSWKARQAVSQGEKRPLHGRFGQGRLRAFALGTTVSWVTTAKDSVGMWKRTTIRADQNSRSEIQVDSRDAVDQKPGTRFEASGRTGLDKLETEKTIEAITCELAPYLLAHSRVHVLYEQSALDPGKNIKEDTSIDLEWEFEGKLDKAILRIIEWNRSKIRSFYLCDDKGVTIDAVDKVPVTDFQFSAYLLWKEMPRHQGEWMLGKLESEPSAFGALLELAYKSIRSHFDERRDARRREMVEEWKARETYPYKGEPATVEERLERAAFDIVATAVHTAVPKPTTQQRLALGLLQDTLRRRPDSVTELLDQYVHLSQNQKEQLESLLRQTSLSRIIQATSNVTDRVDFLRALELMVFDPDASKMVGERDHLHKILENELWIFGERFNSMISEKGLTAVRDRHREVLGVPGPGGPVQTIDGKVGRVDLMLSASARETGRNRHLVVELKAPRVSITSSEIAQIKRYAFTVAEDPQFAGGCDSLGVLACRKRHGCICKARDGIKRSTQRARSHSGYRGP